MQSETDNKGGVEFAIFILFGVLAKVNVAIAGTILIIYAIGTNLNVRIKR